MRSHCLQEAKDWFNSGTIFEQRWKWADPEFALSVEDRQVHLLALYALYIREKDKKEPE